MKHIYKQKSIALLTVFAMILSLAPCVLADSVMFDRLLVETDSQNFSEILDGMTDDEAQSIGIDLAIYKTLSARHYVADEIIKSGFSNESEFAFAFNEAIDALTDEIQYPVSIVKYTPKGRYETVDNNEKVIQMKRTYLYLTADDIENTQYISRLDFYATSNMTSLPGDMLSAYSTEEAPSDAWEAFDSAMQSINCNTIKNDENIHRFSVYNNALSSDTFTIKLTQNSDVYLNLNGAEQGKQPVFIAIYDKTAQIESECIMTPANKSEEIETDISELKFDWITSINTNLFNKDNITIFDMTAQEAVNKNKYEIEIINEYEQKIIFNEELKSEHRYLVSFKNLEDTDDGKIIDRSFTFTTKGVAQLIKAEFNDVLGLNEETDIKFYIQNESGTVKEMDLTYSIADESIVENLGDGKIKAKNYGKTVITAELEGIEAQIPVFVKSKSVNEGFEDFDQNTAEYKHSGAFSIPGAQTSMRVLNCTYKEYAAKGYFYDDMADVKNGGIALSESTGFAGIDTDISEDYYVFSGTAINLKRSEGWHSVIFDVSDNVTVYIDGVYAGEFENNNYNTMLVKGENIWFDTFSMNYLKNSDPEIQNLAIEGITTENTINIGSTVKASYIYYDADDDEPNGMEYGFYYSDTPDGEYIPLAQNVNEYTFNNGDYYNKYIKFIITPKNAVSKGETIETPAYKVVISADVKTIIERINKGDIYEIQNILEQYSVMFDVDIDEINKFENPFFIYDELTNRNFVLAEDVKVAVEAAIDKYLAEIDIPITQAYGFAKEEGEVQDITDEYRFTTYLYQIMLRQIIPNPSAARKITYTAYCSHIASHFMGYSYNELPESLTNQSIKQYADIMPSLSLDGPNENSDSTLRARTFEYPESVVNGLGEDGLLLTHITYTDNRWMYFNSTNIPNRPYYTVTYDKTALNEIEFTSSPAPFEKEVNPDVGRMTFEWSKPLADGVWVNENVSVTDESGVPVSFTLEENAIVFDGRLSDETTYIVSLKNLGESISDKTIKFTTTGVYKELNIKTKTALEVGEKANITVSGLFASDKENTIPVNKIVIVSDNPEIVNVENGIITANHRGNAVLTVTKENYDGTSVSKKIVITVYNKNTSESFESSSDDFAYSGNYSLQADGTEQTLISDSYSDTAEVWYYDNGITDGFVSYGNIKLDITPGAKIWHQVVFVKNENRTDIYLDGVLVKTENAVGNGELKAKINGLAYFDNANISEVKGSLCRVENVVIRGEAKTSNRVDGHYGYFDDDNDEESGTELIWEISSSASGSFKKAGDGSQYKIKDSDGGKYIRFAVTPKNYYDTGVTVYSTAVQIPSSRGTSNSSGGGGGGSGSGIDMWAGNYNPAAATPSTSDATSQRFGDVSASHWAYKNIEQLAELGVISGRSKNTFEPESSITRAEFIKLVVKAINASESKYGNVFADVSSGDWYAGVIQTAFDTGIAQGSDGSFYPNKTITREEMVKFIICAYNTTGRTIESEDVDFKDNSDISDWAVDYVMQACAAGFVNGMDNNYFCPKETATRAQAAVIISRLYKAINN